MRFFSDRESVLLGYDMNDINDMMVFGDKMNTYKKYHMYFGREAISLSAFSDYDAYLSFVKNHSCFVKKNVYKSCGQSVELIDTENDGRNEKDLFEYLISDGKVILEEIVHQSEKMAIFNTSSVNTIRCITLRTKKEMLLPYCFMKIGRDGAFVDNGGAGGILVDIDPSTGMIGTDGVDENGIRYEAHPDSGVHFRGYQLPAWNEIVLMCRQMSEHISTVRMIGWDMAYTDNGWIVIEGNALTEVIGVQSTWLRGIRSDIKSIYSIIRYIVLKESFGK